MSTEMIENSEELWEKWKIAGVINDCVIPSPFCTCCMPEPYLIFNSDRQDTVNSEPAPVFLTTNPGQSWPEIQSLASINDCNNPAKICTGDEYSKTAGKLAKFYGEESQGKGFKISATVKSRINSMKHIANERKFYQIECIPFHSPDIQNKDENFIGKMEKVDLIENHFMAIAAFMENKNIVIVSAGNKNAKLNPWQIKQLKLAGIKNATFETKDIPQKEIGGCTAYQYSKALDKKVVIFCMQGSNKLPSARSLDDVFGNNCQNLFKSWGVTNH